MTAPPKMLGPDELRPMLQAVIDAHPDALNATTARGFCVYTDPDDPARHCLIGQLATEQGWPLPNVNVNADGAAERGRWPVTAAGAALLADVQEQADAATKRCQPWSTLNLAEIGAES